MQRSIGSTLVAVALALAAILATARSAAEGAAPAPGRPSVPVRASVSAPARATGPIAPALATGSIAPALATSSNAALAAPASAPAVALDPSALPPASRLSAAAVEEQIPARNALDALLAALDRLATRERFGPADLLNVPPRSPASAGIAWLPRGRTGLPPRGMIVVPLPAAPLSPTLIAVESTSTMVADARGNDAMLLGLQILPPW